VIVIVITLCQPWSVVFTRRTVVYYALIAAIVVAVLTPVALPYRSAFADSTLSERYSLVNSFGDAVHFADYLTPPSATLAGSLIANNRYWIWGENTLYVGYVALLLSIAALFNRNRIVFTGTALVVAGYVFSLGFVSPSLHIPLPLHYLARVVPSVAGLRATQRFALVIYLGILMLSTSGFVALTRGWTRSRQMWACAVVCALFLLEVFPFTLPIHADTPYAVSPPDRAIAAFQRERATPFVVLHLPIHYFTEPYPISEATYMVDSTLHWANIVNGFSGGAPQGFLERMTTLNMLPDPKAVQLLMDLGVDVIAVHRGENRKEPLQQFFDRQPWASISVLSTGEYLVLIDRNKYRT